MTSQSQETQLRSWKYSQPVEYLPVPEQVLYGCPQKRISSWCQSEHVLFQFCHRLQLTIRAIYFNLLICFNPNFVLMVGVQTASLSTAGRNDATLTANRKTTIAMGFSMACGNSLHQGRYPDAEGKDTKPSNGCRQFLLSTVAVKTFHTVFPGKKLWTSCQGRRFHTWDPSFSLFWDLSLADVQILRSEHSSEQLRCNSLGPMHVLYLGIWASLYPLLPLHHDPSLWPLAMGKWGNRRKPSSEACFLLTSVII